MRLSVTKRDIIFLLFAAGLTAIYTTAGGGGFPLDDSWIHQTYGRNLAVYGEWAFLPGMPSAASTSPLYTVLLAIGYKLGIPYMLWTHALGSLALAGIAALGARIVDLLHPENRRAGWAAGMALLLTWHLIWSAAAGMETALFSMLVLLVIWLSWWQIEWVRESMPRGVIGAGAVSGIAAALTALARPEGILIGGLAVLGLFLALWQRHQKVFLFWVAGFIPGFLVTMTPYLVLNWQLTGGLLPNTANAKFMQHAVLLTLPYPYRFYKLAEAILAGGQILLLPGIVAYGWVRWKNVRWSEFVLAMLPLLWAVGLIATYAFRLPAWYQHGRYVIPALPVLIICGVAGMIWMMDSVRYARQGLERIGRVLLRVLLISTGLLYVIFALWGIEIYRTDVAIIDGEMVNAAHWIRDHLPPDELLAIHDIGAVGYFAPRPMIDIAGLISPELVPLLGDPQQLWLLLEERNARYLLAFPNQVPGGAVDDPRLCPIYTTNAAITRSVGEPNMTIYRLAWDATCEG